MSIGQGSDRQRYCCSVGPISLRTKNVIRELIKEYAVLATQRQGRKSPIYNIQNDGNIDEILSNIVQEIGFDFRSARAKIERKPEPTQLELPLPHLRYPALPTCQS